MDVGVFVGLLFLLSTQAAYFTVKFLRSWRASRENLVIVFVLVSNFLASLIPAYVVLITGNFTPFLFGYDLSVWCWGLSLELVFFTVLALTFEMKRWSPFADKVALSMRTCPRVTGFLILLFIVSGMGYVALWGPWSTSGYEAAGDYVGADLNSLDVTVGAVQGTIYHSLIIPLACILFFYVPKSKIPFWLRPLFGFVLVFALVKALASGGRGAVLEILLAIASCLLAAGKRVRAGASVLVTMALLAALSGAIIEFRSNAERYADLSVWNKAGIILQNWKDGGSASGPANWAETYLTRFDAVQDAGILANWTRATDSFAFFRPFVGAIVATIPRYFWSNKPLPLSDNGMVSGLPWYRVMAYRGQPWNNGGVTASGIAYWQFGWLGVVATAFVSAIALRSLAAVFIRGGPAGLLVFLTFGMMLHFRLPVALDETIFVFLQVSLPLLIFFGIYRMVVTPAVRKRHTNEFRFRPGRQRLRVLN